MNKQMTAADVVAQLEDGMTIGIGGWGRGASRWRWCGKSCALTSRISP
ncbi:hypothetical protein [Halioglobus japonicus]|nr:hypothetical protein [Halioglobus japonicus]